MPAVAELLELKALALDLVARASRTTDADLKARACEASRALGRCAGLACRGCPLNVPQRSRCPGKRA